MNIKKDLLLPGNLYLDREEQLSDKFFDISPYTLLENIPEMLCEWWSSTKKDMHTFLKDEGLTAVIDDKTFTDILLGKYHFSHYFLMLIREKIPYNVSLEKLYQHNKRFMKLHGEAERLNVDDGLIIKILKDIYAQKNETREQYIREWHGSHKSSSAEASARYRLTHADEVRESKKKYRQTHKEKIKAYKKSRREIENEQQRKRYHADIEKSREKKRLYNQNMSEEQKAKVAQYKKEYDRTHRDEINERARERMKDESCRLKKQEKDRESYKRRAKKIQERKTQKRLQNLEEARAAERAYGKVYRANNRDKINARSRADYQKDLVNNRKKNAEKQRKSRAKKRFRTTTGVMIMSFLEAVMLSKKEY